MGFENYYQRYSRTKEEIFTKEKEDNLGDNKILRLFGFVYKEIVTSESRTVVTEENAFGTVLSSKVTDTTYYAETYTRVKPPVNAELEDAFARLYFEKYPTVWDSPYICASEREHYLKTADDLFGDKRKQKRMTIALIVATVVLLALNWGFFALLVGAAGFAAHFLIDFSKDEKKWDEGKVTAEQKEKVRQDWFAEMDRVYGPEMGAILKQMAIEANYDLSTGAN